MPDPTYEPLVWDQIGERLYQIGVSNGVLFPYDTSNSSYGNGVAWNGLVNVTEKPSGAEASPLYADNIKYLDLISNEQYGLSIEAFMYPDEFKACNGESELATGVSIGQQKRSMFGFSWMSKIGNDTDGNDHGYIIHLAYGCRAGVTEQGHATINESAEAPTMSWEVSTTPIEVAGFKPTAHIAINSLKVNNDTKMTTLKNKIWGSTTNPPTMPTISDLLTIFGSGNG